MNVEILSVPAIVTICYLIGMIVKTSPIDNKWIPALCGIFGGALGLTGLHLIADFPANNVLGAVAVGIVSGLSATGINEVAWQLSKKGELEGQGADA